MAPSTASAYEFETGVYRPPSEGGSYSLLLRFTRNCPWNRCAFCGMYKTEKFELRPVAEIKSDIDAMAAICSELKEIAMQMGNGGRIGQKAALALMTKHPELNYHQGFVMLYNWLISGGKTAFLQDANSLIMKTEHLVEALQYLRSTFPSLERVTTYARSKTIAQKSDEELRTIREAGLDRLHVGLESGDGQVLTMIKKGADPQTHIKGGRKAVEAGFQLSEYWMPGLGGQALWKPHAVNTAKVLNAINPHYIRSRPFHPWEGTPLTEALVHGAFAVLTPDQQLMELRLTMETLDVTSKVCFDHAGNYWKNRSGGYIFSHDYEGYQFPGEKQRVLGLIDEGLKAHNIQDMRLLSQND
jgi:histone acetyltransferase (RNA polymerase elongator complex component)